MKLDPCMTQHTQKFKDFRKVMTGKKEKCVHCCLQVQSLATFLFVAALVQIIISGTFLMRAFDLEVAKAYPINFGLISGVIVIAVFELVAAVIYFVGGCCRERRKRREKDSYNNNSNITILTTTDNEDTLYGDGHEDF